MPDRRHVSFRRLRDRARSLTGIARIAAQDPSVSAAVDVVVSTMRQHGIVPTPLSLLAHALDEGWPEQQAALFAEILAQRLEGTKP